VSFALSVVSPLTLVSTALLCSCRICQKIFCSKCSADRIGSKRTCVECMTILKVLSLVCTRLLLTERCTRAQNATAKPGGEKKSDAAAAAAISPPRGTLPCKRNSPADADCCVLVRELTPGMQAKVSALKTAEAVRKWSALCSGGVQR
jgi:hypothetical protein